MKRMATALVLGSLLVATQAASADAFTAATDPFPYEAWELPAHSTYSDAHAGDPVQSGGSAFPRETDHVFDIPMHSTYADAHAGDPAKSAGSAFPQAAEERRSPSVRSTYADRNLEDPLRFPESPRTAGRSFR